MKRQDVLVDLDRDDYGQQALHMRLPGDATAFRAAGRSGGPWRTVATWSVPLDDLRGIVARLEEMAQPFDDIGAALAERGLRWRWPPAGPLDATREVLRDDTVVFAGDAIAIDEWLTGRAARHAEQREWERESEMLARAREEVSRE